MIATVIPAMMSPIKKEGRYVHTHSMMGSLTRKKCNQPFLVRGGLVQEHAYIEINY